MSISFLSADPDYVAYGAGSGGTEVTSGDYKYHTFTSSGTFTVSTAGLFEVLAVAGGGGSVTSSTSVPSGGAGAGELRNCLIYLSAAAHTITIGAGGAGDANVASIGGNTSVGDNMLLTGGGPVRSKGGGISVINGCGACGAGGSSDGSVFTYKGIGLVGFDGGEASASVGGGGGGMGEAGKSYITTGSRGGGGGNGLSFIDWATATSTGDSTYYAGGGAGQSTTGVSDPGGLGGGGDLGANGSANTGGGAGAGNYSGGSGIVIIRYAA